MKFLFNLHITWVCSGSKNVNYKITPESVHGVWLGAALRFIKKCAFVGPSTDHP